VATGEVVTSGIAYNGVGRTLHSIDAETGERNTFGWTDGESAQVLAADDLGLFVNVGSGSNLIEKVDFSSGQPVAGFTSISASDVVSAAVDGEVLYVNTGTAIQAFVADSGEPQPFSVTADGAIEAMSITSDGIYLAGTFTSLNGTPAGHIAK